MPAKGTTPALTPEQANRYTQVLELRKAGRTFDEIAEALNYADRSGAKHAYDAAIKRMGREAAEDLRELELYRLEDLWASAYARAINLPDDDHDAFLKFGSHMLNISRRRSGLMGLDAPRQVEVSGPDGEAIRTDIGELFRAKLRELEQ